MKKEIIFEKLVSFETAKLAKIKGFDNCTEAVFFINSDDDSKIRKSYHSEDWGGDETSDELIFRPSQSVLQKWLREKHNINIVIDYFIDEDDNNIYIPYCYSFLVTEEDSNEEKRFDTYEEALEYALDESLNFL